MSYFRIIIFNIFLFLNLSLNAHNPENFIIAEIEQGQINFENEQIAEEYNSALKRQRIRRLSAMSWEKKFSIFIKSGFDHIIPKGFDHIIFILGLFFSFIHFRSLVLQVSVFTIAHSITLILAAQNIIKIDGSIVEPLIALSIVWIAIENCIFKKLSKWRYFIVFCFGLLHGLGFASVLSEYGIPKDNFISSLLAFNIGVEFGQIFVLITTFILLKLILNRSSRIERIKLPASIVIGLIGLFWFIERIINL